MKKQLTTLSLVSLFAFATPAINCKEKEAAEVQSTLNKQEDSWEDIFIDMHNSMNRMQRKMAEDFETHMQDLRDDIEEIFTAAAAPSVQISSNTDELTINIHNISTNELDIKADNDRLVIKSAEATIEIAVDGNLLTTYITQESKQEIAKDGAKSQSSAVSQSAMSQTIRHAVDLSKAKAQSDEKEKSLSIIVPFLVKTPTQTIPVEKKASK